MDIIIIPTKSSKYFTPIHKIVFCQIELSKTIFHLADNETVESDKGFAHFKNRFNTNRFFKPNQSHLININHIEKVLFKKPPVIVMKNQAKITVDIDKAESLFQIIENI